MDDKTLNALSSAIFVSRCTLAGEAVDTDDKRLRASGLYPDWVAGHHAKGDIYNADGQTWECYQEYDNATYPDIRPGEAARPFVPVQGSHDMYRAGEYMVWTDGTIYRCKTDTNFSPADYAQAWEPQEESAGE